MELMRKKLAALRGEGTKDSTSVWFKPDEGDTDIRIVPSSDCLLYTSDAADDW